jgi:hypothetical protein
MRVRHGIGCLPGQFMQFKRRLDDDVAACVRAAFKEAVVVEAIRSLVRSAAGARRRVGLFLKISGCGWQRAGGFAGWCN